jgi:hypothetical protein
MANSKWPRKVTGVPVELSLDGVVWGLANGEIRIPLRGEDDAIAWFMAGVREMASSGEGCRRKPALT